MLYQAQVTVPEVAENRDHDDTILRRREDEVAATDIKHPNVIKKRVMLSSTQRVTAVSVRAIHGNPQTV